AADGAVVDPRSDERGLPGPDAAGDRALRANQAAAHRAGRTQSACAGAGRLSRAGFEPRSALSISASSERMIRARRAPATSEAWITATAAKAARPNSNEIAIASIERFLGGADWAVNPVDGRWTSASS